MEKFERGQRHGQFEGFVLILDIVDFTHISEIYQNGDLHGADSIGRLLNRISVDLIGPICSYGGFVNLFVGDAISAVFPGSRADGLLSALSEIREFLLHFCSWFPDADKRTIDIREAISFGKIEWAIFEDPHQNEYLFSGKPFTEVTALSALDSKHLYSTTAINQIGKHNFRVTPRETQLHIPQLQPKQNPLKSHFKRKTQELFIHQRYRNLSQTAEIRNVVACFVGLSADRNPGQELRILHQFADKLHGFVNKIDYTNDIPVVVVLFGIPKSLGKSVHQACEFAMELMNAHAELSIGISCGYAYAGYIGNCEIHEYTALGNCMNIAARLQAGAQPGRIICDSSIFREVGSLYSMQHLGGISLKGVSNETPFYLLQRRKTSTNIQFPHIFVGRQEELAFIGYVKRCALTHKRHSILYVNGDPGQGKSRLVWEFVRDQKDVHVFISIARMQNGQPMLAVIQLIQSFFGITEEKDTSEINKRLQVFLKEKKWEISNPGRFLSVLGMILGADVSGTALANISEEEKLAFISSSFNTFITKLLDEKPIIWMLDDGQWLDDSSCSILRKFDVQAKHPLILISPCRLLETGKPVDLELHNFARYDINLNPMSVSDQLHLLQQILDVKQDSKHILHAVISKSGGYPLYLEQMAYYLLERCEGCNTEQLLISSQQINSFSISDIINSRLDCFSHRMRDCIYQAAILGMHFDVKLLEHIMQENIQQLLQLGVNHRLWERKNKNRYSFSHVLIRDLVYERLLKEEQTLLHRRTAETLLLLSDGAENAECAEIAYHFQQANCIPQAQEYYFKSSRYHMKMSNWNLGIRMQKAATILSGRHFGFGSPEHVENLFWIALNYHYIQYYAKAETIYLIVLNHKKQHLSSDSALMSPYINNLGRFYKDTARYEEAEPLLRHSLCIEHRAQAGSTNVADRLNNIASLYTKMCNWRKALAYSRKALEIFEHCAHHERNFFVALLNMNIGYLHLNMGEILKAEERCLQAVKLFKTSCGPSNPRLAKAHQLLGQVCLLQAKYREAELRFLSARSKFGKFFGKDSPDYAQANITLGDLYEVMGDKAKASRFWKKGAEVLLNTMPGGHPYAREAQLRMQKVSALTSSKADSA